VVELQEEVTQAEAATIMAAARAAQGNTVLLATTHGEAMEVTHRVSISGEELVSMCRARGATEEKILSLTAKAAMADQRREASKE
jgi:hypothetical protein